jgi:outer membrane cobalamin receptor
MLAAATFAALLFSATSHTAASAADPAPAPSPSPSDLPEIARVVTPDRQSETVRDSSKTVYVITKDQMNAYGYTSVADALTRVPGVVVERYAGAGSLANVFVRGASPAQTLVLLDGKPAAGAQSGTLDLGSFSTTGVQRIEVVEGGGSTLYGSNAIGGVINIITGATHGTPNVNAYAGSFDDRAINIEAGPLSLERGTAANDYSYIDPATGATMTRLNAEYALWNGRLAGGKQFGNFRLDGAAGLSSSSLGVPGSLDFLSTTSRQDTTNEYLSTTLTHFGARSRATLDLYGSRQTLNYFSAADDPNGCFCGNDLNAESRVQASLRDVISAGRQNLVFGTDLAHGSARIDAGNGSVATLGFAQTAIYAQDTIDLSRARFYGGLRAEQDGGLGGSLNPSVGTTIVLTPDIRLKANYATAFRVPTIVDLAYPGFSNPNLTPERAQVTDVSLGADRTWGSLALTWFTTAATDLISVNPAYDYSQPSGPSNVPVVNIQQASIAGLTFTASTLPRHGISAQLGITDLYRALGFIPGENAARLPLRPVFDVTLGLQYTGTPNALVSGAGIGTRSVGWRGDGADPYSVVDGFFRFRLAPRALLTFRALNLGNERYFDVPGYPSPGRAFVVELGTK